jgi:hypothetical protein
MERFWHGLEIASVIKRLGLAVMTALCVMVFAEHIHATPISVENADFQAGSAGLGAGELSAWNSNTGATDQYNPYEFNGGNVWYVGANPSTDPANGGPGYPGLPGEYLGYIYNQGSDVSISQTLSATLQANTTYTLTVGVGARNGSYSFNAFGGALIELYAGTTLIGSTTYTTQTVGTFTDDTLTIDSSGVNPDLIGQALQIQLHTAASGSTDFDSVSLDAMSDGASVVPEPSSLILIATAMAAGLTVARRRLPTRGNS